MAVYNSNLIIKNANGATHGESREAQHAFATVAIAAALVAGDTINLLNLPAYARVIGACVSADQLDSNGAATISLKVGDAGYGSITADAARYFTTTAVGRVASPADANANANMNGHAQNFLNGQPATLEIFATVVTAAATFAAGNLYFRIAYYIDEPVSVLNQ